MLSLISFLILFRSVFSLLDAPVESLFFCCIVLCVRRNRTRHNLLKDRFCSRKKKTGLPSSLVVFFFLETAVRAHLTRATELYFRFELSLPLPLFHSLFLLVVSLHNSTQVRKGGGGGEGGKLDSRGNGMGLCL